MATLANINGASLVPDFSSSLDSLANTFEARRQEELKAAQQQKMADLIAAATGTGGQQQGSPPSAATPGINPGAPSPAAQSAALLELTALDPAAGKAINGIIESRDKRQMAQAKQAMEADAQFAVLLEQQPSHEARLRILRQRAEELMASGGPQAQQQVDELVRISNLPPEDLDVHILKTKIAAPKAVQAIDEMLQGPDGFTLSQGQQRFDAEGNEIASVAPASKLLSREEEAQKIRIAGAQARAAAAPTAGLARLIAEQRLSTEQLRQRELEGKIEDRGEKLKRGREAVVARKQAAQAKALVVTGKVDEALKIADKALSTGFAGQILSGVGGTDARNLEATVDTLKANLSFSELQAMREASPSGGALGSIAVRELDLLGSTISSLDISQSADQLKRNLENVKKHYQNWLEVMNKSPTPKRAEDVDTPVIKFTDL